MLKLRCLVLAITLMPSAALADKATEGCASTQLSVAQQTLERARVAALRGEAQLASTLAWQASLDARLTWVMTERVALRAQAWTINREAGLIVSRFVKSQ
jgi:hypothetical protein